MSKPYVAPLLSSQTQQQCGRIIIISNVQDGEKEKKPEFWCKNTVSRRNIVLLISPFHSKITPSSSPSYAHHSRHNLQQFGRLIKALIRRNVELRVFARIWLISDFRRFLRRNIVRSSGNKSGFHLYASILVKRIHKNINFEGRP